MKVKEHEQMTTNERIEIQKEIYMSTDDNMTEQVYKPLKQFKKIQVMNII